MGGVRVECGWKVSGWVECGLRSVMREEGERKDEREERKERREDCGCAEKITNQFYIPASYKRGAASPSINT